MVILVNMITKNFFPNDTTTVQNKYIKKMVVIQPIRHHPFIGLSKKVF